MKLFKHWCGIDFGSKMAGTTCICFREGDKLRVAQSEKKHDADEFLAAWFSKEGFDAVFIDAPLSLPQAYFDSSASDFLFRKADRAIHAMSPMFLGGLTARAMQFRHRFAPIPFYEAYPGGLVRHLEWTHLYAKGEAPNAKLFEAIAKHVDIGLPQLDNTHQLDAVLAWVTGWRVVTGKSVTFGDESEGLIYV